MSHPAKPRLAGGVALPAVIALLALALWPAGAGASQRLHPPAEAGISADQEVARIAAYWTPKRMRETPPLAAFGAPRDPLEPASFGPVADATVTPYAVNGRIFLRQGKKKGYCSGTAINSPTRRLVLTAGHCVNSGPRGRRGTSAWSRYLEFVPAYTGGAAPFGTFIARRPDVYAPEDWVRFGNPNHDIGAFLVEPNAEGVDVADAVGGGATIALDRPRQESFQTFGYPGKARRLQECDSPTAGEDRLTFQIPGPPTMRIRCHWLPGASGGGWLIDDGTVVNGLTSYGREKDLLHTFGPYFSKRTVGRVVAGF